MSQQEVTTGSSLAWIQQAANWSISVLPLLLLLFSYSLDWKMGVPMITCFSIVKGLHIENYMSSRGEGSGSGKRWGIQLRTLVAQGVSPGPWPTPWYPQSPSGTWKFGTPDLSDYLTDIFAH